MLAIQRTEEGQGTTRRRATRIPRRTAVQNARRSVVIASGSSVQRGRRTRRCRGTTRDARGPRRNDAPQATLLIQRIEGGNASRQMQRREDTVLPALLASTGAPAPGMRIGAGGSPFGHMREAPATVGGPHRPRHFLHQAGCRCRTQRHRQRPQKERRTDANEESQSTAHKPIQIRWLRSGFKAYRR